MPSVEKGNLIIVMGPTGSGKGYAMDKYLTTLTNKEGNRVDCLIDNLIEEDDLFKRLNKIVLKKMIIYLKDKKKFFDFDKAVVSKNIESMNFSDENEIVEPLAI